MSDYNGKIVWFRMKKDVYNGRDVLADSSLHLTGYTGKQMKIRPALKNL